MNIYMVYDKANDGWYKRAGVGGCGHWVNQEEASVWTKKQGPVAAIAAIKKYMQRTQCLMLKRDAERWHTPEPVIVTLIAQYAVPQIAIARADNWLGIYLDGTLVEEGSTAGQHGTRPVQIEHVLDRLGLPPRVVYVDQDWFAARGSLPKTFEEVESEIATLEPAEIIWKVK